MSVSIKSGNLAGYAAGIITGVTYGMNPLFAKPLLLDGISVDTMLFFRYLMSVSILGVWLLLRRHGFSVNRAQFIRLAILGVLFAMSSLLLFTSYNYINSGLATTIIYIYPVLVAIIMVFLKVYPTWQVWLSIILTFAGVVILSNPTGSSGGSEWEGMLMAGCSALAYALYLVIINRSRRLRTVDSNLLTFYALLIGSGIFLIHHFFAGGSLTHGMDSWKVIGNMLGLAIFPTTISLVTLALSTRLIGATRTSVLGVFEPITAIMIGTLLFGESITVNVIAGVAITLIAVTFMILTSAQDKSRGAGN